MKSLVLVALFILPGFSSFAGVVIRPSVSEGFYVCNAGIAHRVATGKSCISQTTGNTCDASSDSSCVCSDSALRQDSIAAAWNDLTVADTSPLRSRSNVITSNKLGTLTSLFTDTNAWNNNLTSIQVDSSSETYGTTYFVDFCYEGPIESIKKINGRNVDQSQAIYNLTANVAAQNLGSGYLYQQDANLGMTLTVNCDLRDVGKYQDARTSSLLIPTNGILESDMSFASNGTPRSSSLSVTQRLNSKTDQVPRFCTVRATFTEMSGSTAVKVRPNSASPTEFTVDLDISPAGSLL